ncbi:MAG: hypothetical protein ABJZ55_12655 [Fuerstiella sp.]
MRTPIVKIQPGIDEQGSGLTSSIQYTNPDFANGIRDMFRMQDHEELLQVEIQDGRITVRMRTANHSA